MGRNLLVPRHATFRIIKPKNTVAIKFNASYPEEAFDSVHDWFFFFHINPVVRFVHTFGMLVGLICFVIAAISWNWFTFVWLLIGSFFFYYLGGISHMIYDPDKAKVRPIHLMTGFLPVVRINMLTLMGRYDKALRQFQMKYPFTTEAHDLIEIDSRDLLTYLLKKKSLSK